MLRRISGVRILQPPRFASSLSFMAWQEEVPGLAFTTSRFRSRQPRKLSFGTRVEKSRSKSCQCSILGANPTLCLHVWRPSCLQVPCTGTLIHQQIPERGHWLETRMPLDQSQTKIDSEKRSAAGRWQRQNCARMSSSTAILGPSAM
jgi:hypothetical protein